MTVALIAPTTMAAPGDPVAGENGAKVCRDTTVQVPPDGVPVLPACAKADVVARTNAVEDCDWKDPEHTNWACTVEFTLHLEVDAFGSCGWAWTEPTGEGLACSAAPVAPGVSVVNGTKEFEHIRVGGETRLEEAIACIDYLTAYQDCTEQDEFVIPVRLPGPNLNTGAPLLPQLGEVLAGLVQDAEDYRDTPVQPVHADVNVE